MHASAIEDDDAMARLDFDPLETLYCSLASLGSLILTSPIRFELVW